MSDKMRWRYGDTNPVVAAVAATTVIEIGDLLWQDTDNAKPAALLPDRASKAANQQAMVAKFLGVAMTRSRQANRPGPWPPRACSNWTAPRNLRTGRPDRSPTARTGLLNQQAVAVTDSHWPSAGLPSGSRWPPPACWSTCVRP